MTTYYNGGSDPPRDNQSKDCYKNWYTTGCLSTIVVVIIILFILMIIYR